MTFEYYEHAMEHNCRRHRKEDSDEFAAIEALLPAKIDGDCGYCGPHSYLPMRLAIELVKPTSILEIGFNIGHSSLFWLRNTKADVVSIDVRVDYRVNEAVKVCEIAALESGNANRFHFFHRNSVDHDKGMYDFAFIDGSHVFNDVLKDIQECTKLGIPYLLLDDWLTLYGDVQRAVMASGLKIVFISGNQVLVTTSGDYTRYYK